MPAAYVGAAAALGSAVSGIVGSSSVDSAAGKANQVSQQAIDAARTSYAPYMTAGTSGVNRYADLLGVNGPDAATAAMRGFVASPGYSYQVEQGLRGVDAAAASRGMLRSGATLKAEQTLGNNLANLDFGNYLGRLNTLATNGLSATGNFVNTLSGQATQQQQTLVSQGANDASIFGNAAKGVTGAIGTAYQNGLFGTPQTSGGGTSYNSFGYTPAQVAQINDPYNY